MPNTNLIMNIFRKRMILPFTIILALLSLINFYFIFEVTPQPNDECLWIPKKGEDGKAHFYFDEVKFQGVTWNAGIRDGDELIAINERKITNVFVANYELNMMFEGDSALYKISRNGYEFETKVEVKKLIQIGGLSFAILGSIWLIVGLIVMSAKPDGQTQVIFYRLGATIVLFSTFNLLLQQNTINPLFDYPLLAAIIDNMWSFGAAFLPFVIVHFFWVFPKPKKIINRRFTKKILYGIPTVIFFAFLIPKIIWFYPEGTSPNFYYAVYYQLTMLILLIASITGLISLFASYLKIKSAVERNSIFVILISYSIGVAAIIYISVIGAVLNPAARYNAPEYFLPFILISLLPISFAYSIFKYSLMDVSDVIKNTILYGTATVAVAAVYFFVIYVLGQSVSSAIGTEYQGIIAGIIFIAFAMVFQSTKDKFQELLTRKFYPEQFVYQKVILKFSNDISTIVGLDNIVASTCKTFVEALKLNVFGIVLSDPETGYSFQEGKGVEAEGFNFIVHEDELKIFMQLKNEINQPIVIEHTEFEKVFQNKQLFERNKIYTVIPLLIKYKVIGFLLFGLKHSGSKFAGKDLELLSAAANQTAVSVENARLYEAERDKLKMERDLENARKIQNSLLPSVFPEIKKLSLSGIMIPAMQVGGDYFDLIKVSDTKLFVIVGDVSGKGLSASFYMSKLQTMMQLYATAEKSPKQVLMEVNKRIFTSIERNWFITISIALFDTESMKLTFCRAGHTPLIKINNKSLEYFTPGGIGVGLEKGNMFDTTIEEMEIDLNAGDFFTIYSDGITEAMNKNREQYTLEKFSTLLKNCSNLHPNQIETEIINSIKEFQGKTPQHDDITLVLVKVNES